MENKVQTDFSLLILLSCISLITGIIAATWFMHYRKKLLSQINEMEASQKILLNAINQVAEIERETIAKNLHDDIGIQLNVVKLHLTKVSRNLNNIELFRDLIVESMELLDESIQNVRTIAKDLIPPTLIKLGYAKGISELCRQINISGQLKIELYDNYNEIRLNPVAEMQVYRITQEVLNNIVKHARASKIRVYIDSDVNKVVTIIAHDGEGISEEMIRELSQTDRGIGLKNIHSRAELINASVKYFENDGNDSVIKIEIPVL